MLGIFTRSLHNTVKIITNCILTGKIVNFLKKANSCSTGPIVATCFIGNGWHSVVHFVTLPQSYQPIGWNIIQHFGRQISLCGDNSNFMDVSHRNLDPSSPPGSNMQGCNKWLEIMKCSWLFWYKYEIWTLNFCDALFNYVNVFFDDERYCIVEWGGAIMIVFAPLIGDLNTVSPPLPPPPLTPQLYSQSL